MSDYFIILADPPWAYHVWNDRGAQKSAEHHYRTMPLETICGLPVARLAASDSLLFLWATSPNLEQAFQVMRAWGFDYKSSLVWNKSGVGLGYYVRVDHELLLIGTRGNPGAPHPSRRRSSVVYAPKGRHSKKPGVFHEIIDRMYPEGKRIELFCRDPRPGWDAWGNQAEGLDIIEGQPRLEGLVERGRVLPLDFLKAGA